MGRNLKYSREEKIRVCKAYDNGKGSFRSLAKEIETAFSVVRSWYLEYKIHGEFAFDHSERNKSYSKEFKSHVVLTYLSGKYSLHELAALHKLSLGLVQKWVSNHYNGIENKGYDPKGEVYTMKSRKTTFEERLKIVKWVIANDMNYKEAADKHAINYALVYQWVKKYLTDGEDGLKHKKRGPRAKSKIDESTLSEVERLKLELEREKALREKAEFRLELFKKKEEFAQKRRSRK